MTRAVHEAGGQIACQLMHCGRVGHPDNKATSTRLLGPGPAARAKIFTEGGMKAMPTPEPMSLEDIDQAIADYGLAAERL